jgi:hypothetical protein
MPSRKDIGRRIGQRRGADEFLARIEAPDERPPAQGAIDRTRADTTAASDCAERVAGILQDLGYGFAMIRRGKSARHGH